MMPKEQVGFVTTKALMEKGNISSRHLYEYVIHTFVSRASFKYLYRYVINTFCE